MSTDTKPNRRLRQCEGKNVYFTWEDARRVREEVFLKRGDIVYEYRCPVCRWIHLGHPRQTRITAKPGDWMPQPMPRKEAEISRPNPSPEAMAMAERWNQARSLDKARMRLINLLKWRLRQMRREEEGGRG